MQSGTAIRKVRLAYVVSHPIQYQAELLRAIAADPAIDLCVFFCSDFSAGQFQDKGFGVSISWDVPLLSGYHYVVLPRWLETHSPGTLRPISRGFYRNFRRGINGQPFDAVWIHGYSTVNAFHAMLAAKALGIPVLVRSDSWLGDRSRSPLKLLLKRGFFRTLSGFVDGILSVGTRNSEYWAHYMGDKFPIFVMPYAVNNEFFARRTAEASTRRTELQHELGLDPARPVILYASKLQKRKHCDHLLEAYIQLRQQTQLSPQLLIVGDGEKRQQLEERARSSGVDGIHFVGFRNQSELPRFFDLSTMFVLPARHEPWGLIVNEAMAAGKPVIASDQVGAAADLLHQGENGFIFPMGDIAALRDAIIQTLAPGVAETMGEHSREILSTWGFPEDLIALHAALRFITRKSIS